MKIALLGRFKNLYDEEYIAQSFEMLGHKVLRLDERNTTLYILGMVDGFNPDYVLWVKLMCPDAKKVREGLKKYKTICWVFDLYFDYIREYRLTSHPAFTADYMFSTDGGHQEAFKSFGINHKCVRQGIFKSECILLPSKPSKEVVFVGSENSSYPARTKQMSFLKQEYGDNFKWYGRLNTNEVRGLSLNELYSHATIVVGDSVSSSNYWSNRVVETLGRGGFLIHRDVAGIKEEYPDLVTYDGTLENLKEKIDYYLTHEEERLRIIRKNFEWVRDNYTMDKKCQELLNHL